MTGRAKMPHSSDRDEDAAAMENMVRMTGGVPCVVRRVCGSTSSDPLLFEGDAPDFLTVVAVEQTAGRGQRGNSWEAEPGKNLTLTMMVRPRGLAPRRQFAMSVAVSLAITDAVSAVADFSEPLKIKWPNDIYVGDGKLAGILIQHTLAGGAIERTVIGVGLNVNQRVFRSDAPNPVSLSGLTGREYDLDEVLECVLSSMRRRLTMLLEAPDEVDAQMAEYHAMLWRHDAEKHRWFESESGRILTAAIDRVDDDGTFYLVGNERGYAFKEIHPVLDPLPRR